MSDLLRSIETGCGPITVRDVARETLEKLSTLFPRIGWTFSESLRRIPPVVVGITIRASEDRMREIGERLHRWVEDLSDPRDRSAGIEYGGLVMFFPTELAARDGATDSSDTDES